MDDIVTLGIRIDSLQAEVAANRMNKLAHEGSKAEKSAISMGAAYKVAAAGVLALGGAIYKILEKTSEFQVLNANLVTATGSIEGANKAFAALKTLAQTTPFTLQEVTTAFTKLVNYGLTPSERAIKSYGDTAAASGKPIISLVEGVADAVNGEFERVKEAFNVKAKNLGDTVAFRFRGVTTEVKNNAHDIEEYFIRLGETKFAGGMARQMDTLKGKASNMQDAWELMLNALGTGRLDELAKGGLTDVTDKLNEITEWAERGGLDAALYQTEALIASQIPQWGELGRTITDILGGGTTLLAEFVAQAQPDSEEWESYWNDVFTHFPSNINYMLKLSQLYVTKFLEDFADAMTMIENKAGKMGSSLAASLAHLKVDLSTYTSRSLGSERDNKHEAIDKAKEAVDSKLDIPDWNNDADLQEHIDTLNSETEALKHNADAQKERADQMRRNLAEADALLAEYSGDGMVLPPKDGYDAWGLPNENIPGLSDPNGGDVLAGFYQGGDSSASNAKAGKIPKAKIVKEKPEGALQAEYEAELLKTIYEKEAQNEWDALNQSEERIRQSYLHRRTEILANTELTERQKAELIKRNDQQLADAQADFTRKRNETQLKLASDFYGNLSTIAGAFGKKGHKAAQAAAIAKTLVDTYSSATASYNSLASIPYVGPALGAAAAAAAVASGFANIQKIRSTEYTGAFADGGIVPGNSTSGDRLHARVNSREMILNQGQQKRLFDMANGGDSPSSNRGEGSPWRLVVHNNAAGHTAEVNEDRDAKLVEITIGKTIDRIAAEAARGGGKVDKAFQQAYKLKR